MLLAPLTHSAFTCWALRHTRQATRGGRKWVPVAGVPKGHMEIPEPEDMWSMVEKQAKLTRVLKQTLLPK